jgi:hypothetical protein
VINHREQPFEVIDTSASQFLGLLSNVGQVSLDLNVVRPLYLLAGISLTPDCDHSSAQGIIFFAGALSRNAYDHFFQLRMTSTRDPMLEPSSV